MAERNDNANQKLYRLLLEQLERNVAAIKEIGENFHELRNDIHENLWKLKEELRKEIDGEVADLRKELGDTRRDIAVLQVKSGVWGAIGAISGVLGIWLAQKFLN